MKVRHSLRQHYMGLAVSALLCMAPVVHAASPSIDVPHVQGSTQVTTTPQKVVSYDLAALDTLRMLGVPVVGVPELKYPPSLAEFSAMNKVGTLFEPNYEALNALDPDLVIVAGRSQPKYADVSRVAPTIDLTLDNAQLLNDVKKNTLTLGKVFNKTAQAEAEIKAVDDAIAQLKDKASKQGTALIVLTTGGRMSAYGPGSRFGILHENFGFKPAVENLEVATHGQAISHEFIQKTNPDWLFVIDRDAAIGREGQSAKQFLDNPLVNQTTAWKKNQVVYLDGTGWYLLGSGSLPAIKGNIDQLNAALEQAR